MDAERVEKAQLVEVSQEDTVLLARLCDYVNRNYFSGRIDIAARWEIPSASESPEPKLDLSSLSSAEIDGLALAVEAYARRDFITAKDLIQPYVKMGLRDAGQLYVRILMSLKDESWPLVAKKLNKFCADSLCVPAASTEIVDGESTFLIHPALSKSVGYGAPRYVIRYIVFHEMLHIFLKTNPSNPHPDIFRNMEQACPDRPDAIAWLQRHQFSTIEDSLL